MIPLKTITEPTVEPITLAEVKMHCKATDDEDALLNLFIAAARRHAEFVTGRRFMTQVVERVLDTFPAAGIELPGSPIQSITSVKYLEAVAGAETVLAPADYTLDADNEPGWLLPAYGKDWPETFDTALAVRVRYSVGYANAGAVPPNIKLALLYGVAEAYMNREDGVAPDWKPHGRFSTMLQPHKLNLGL